MDSLSNAYKKSKNSKILETLENEDSSFRTLVVNYSIILPQMSMVIEEI